MTQNQVRHSVATTSVEPHLARGLASRHIQLIAIGGTIGSGLFMGAGKSISLAGPSILLVYAIIGFMVFFVMRALGELLLSNLSYRSFADFSGEYLGPWAQFFTGWTYWFCWILAGVADVVAVSGYVSFWFKELALWIPAIGLVFTLLTLNLSSVRNFGETEFWFALIKIVAIVGLIITGAFMLYAPPARPDGAVASLSHLWDQGGFFPNGFMGFVAGFQIAIFSFVGVELVGTAAAEAEDPEVTLPRAINAIPIRVALFYLGSLLVIMTVIPWHRINPGRSPFVEIFSLAGLGAAAHLVNFVVLTSAASSANSGIYSTSRMIFGLAGANQAPRTLGRLNRRRTPANALFFSCSFLLAGVVLLYAGQSIIQAFTVLTTIAAILFIFVWSIILASYVQYRRTKPQLHAASTFRMPGGYTAVVMVFAFFAFVIWSLAQRQDTARALMITPLWFVFLGGVWMVIRRKTCRAGAPERSGVAEA